MHRAISAIQREAKIATSSRECVPRITISVTGTALKRKNHNHK